MADFSFIIPILFIEGLLYANTHAVYPGMPCKYHSGPVPEKSAQVSASWALLHLTDFRLQSFEPSLFAPP